MTSFDYASARRSHEFSIERKISRILRCILALKFFFRIEIHNNFITLNRPYEN